jgi:hypothetical protein
MPNDIAIAIHARAIESEKYLVLLFLYFPCFQFKAEMLIKVTKIKPSREIIIAQ